MSTTESFASRHIGPRPADIPRMLETLDVPGLSSLSELVDSAVPAAIRSRSDSRSPSVGDGMSERAVLQELREIADKNQVWRSYIGLGYYGTFTPPVIQRNVLEDPRWYTPYTPYQSEVSQGRLEALLNFQTMVADMTGMEIANASLLDEATAAAEAMTMCHSIYRGHGRAFFVSRNCHPTTIAVVQTRASALGIEIIVDDHASFDFGTPVFGVLVQYPGTDGVIDDLTPFIERAHAAEALAAVSADILALALLKPPGEMGADIVVGSTQRFGVPIGYGGPHAAYLATRDVFRRQIPGRIVGVSVDAEGRPGVRLALQTREQHIRREKATSNICTAQVLLAVVASMYAIYHGPEGIRAIAERVHGLARSLAVGLNRLGYCCGERPFFDTLAVPVGVRRSEILARAKAAQINLRDIDSQTLGISLDEITRDDDIADLLSIFGGDAAEGVGEAPVGPAYPGSLARASAYLTHPVFNSYRSETEMMRYLNRLANRDLSLASSMIPLGSCTMKLNAAVEMMPISWPEFNSIHPFAPTEQAAGFAELIRRLESMLADLTGFDSISLQPNAGSQGEYTGLLVIRKYHESRGEGHRRVCLIPQSAHGTNPASAALAGMTIAVVQCDAAGNIDVDDLRAQADAHRDDLACLMVTYPSTHGVYEEAIVEICDVVHGHGGQVYMDGANMNALVGISRPGDFGADVCHLNLHKTFCIPHGGGGPGMGPIGVKAHLAPFLPTNPVTPVGGPESVGAVSEAPYGSPSILPISYAYIRLMGSDGLALATKVAILNANYVAKRLGSHYPVLYRGRSGLVAHECIVDLRPLKGSSGVEVEDVAKRLMDYGFHAPTVSFPVPGTMMIEPTESESREELDRFCEAMIAIRQEIAEIERGEADLKDNVLKNAPHTTVQASRTEWDHPYSREKAVFPLPWVRDGKWWPPVARIDNVYGERHLVCSCLPIEDYR